MAKDPAFLFYSQDFYTGVATLTFEERGKFISILCLMHQQGRMREETIRFIVGNISDNLKNKFAIDQQGLWYNRRLELETARRNNFTESRRKNGINGGRPKKSTIKDNSKINHMDSHMGNENENRNAIDNDKKGVQGETIPPLSDKWFNAMLDDIELENLHMTFRDKDVDQEIKTFKAKARAAPENYKHRDKAGILLALHSQLRSAKPKKQNGTHSNTNAAAIIADRGKRAGKL